MTVQGKSSVFWEVEIFLSSTSEITIISIIKTIISEITIIKYSSSVTNGNDQYYHWMCKYREV